MNFYNKYKNIILSNIKSFVVNIMFNSFIKKYKDDIIFVLGCLLICILIYFIQHIHYISDSFIVVFIYIILIITTFGIILYKKLSNRFIRELEDIDNMQQFILDEEYKYSLDFSKRCNDMFIKLITFFTATISGLIFSRIGKDSEIQIIKDFFSQEISLFIVTFLYAAIVIICSLSFANIKKIKILRFKYKNILK